MGINLKIKISKLNTVPQCQGGKRYRPRSGWLSNLITPDSLQSIPPVQGSGCTPDPANLTEKRLKKKRVPYFFNFPFIVLIMEMLIYLKHSIYIVILLIILNENLLIDG